MALRAEEDESVEMVPLASAAVTTVKEKRTFVEAPPEDVQREQVRSFLYPGEDELPDDVSMTIWEHLEELRERALISAAAVHHPWNVTPVTFHGTPNPIPARSVCDSAAP